MVWTRCVKSPDVHPWKVASVFPRHACSSGTSCRHVGHSQRPTSPCDRRNASSSGHGGAKGRSSSGRCAGPAAHSVHHQPRHAGALAPGAARTGGGGQAGRRGAAGLHGGAATRAAAPTVSLRARVCAPLFFMHPPRPLLPPPNRALLQRASVARPACWTSLPATSWQPPAAPARPRALPQRATPTAGRCWRGTCITRAAARGWWRRTLPWTRERRRWGSTGTPSGRWLVKMSSRTACRPALRPGRCCGSWRRQGRGRCPTLSTWRRGRCLQRGGSALPGASAWGGDGGTHSRGEGAAAARACVPAGTPATCRPHPVSLAVQGLQFQPGV